MRNFLFTIFCIFIIALIILNICSAFNISFLGFRIYKVASGSMEPTIAKGDLVIIHEEKKYRENDIVTYEEKGTYITHRIINISNNVIITKGDNNNIQDDPIQKQNIVGKLIIKINSNEIINYLFSPPQSFIILFVVGLFITWLIPDKERKNRGKHAI